MKSLLILLVALLGASEATYPAVSVPGQATYPGVISAGGVAQSVYPSASVSSPIQHGGGPNALLPVQTWSQNSGQYNELNKDIISKHKQFRVTADERFQWEALDQINAKRSLHDNTRPLKLGYKFANYTVERAHSILRDIENKRDIAKGQLPLGESFFWYYDPNRYRSVDDAINTWYQEKRNYDYNRPGFSAKTGGFTQLVWKGTREATCAKIDYETREHYKTLVVCNFYPAGNVNGEFPYNVLPPRRGGGGGGGGGRPPTRPEYPDDERPSRPGGGGGGRPPSRPEYPDDERPSRPGGGGGGRPPTRPDDDRPSRPGGGGGGRPRPPYDEDDYDRPNRPGGGGGSGGGYPTRPISVSGSTETILYPQQSSAEVPKPVIVEPQAQAVFVAQVDPASLNTIGQQGQPQPTVYAAGQLPQQVVQQDQQPLLQTAQGQSYEPIEAILIVPQYANGQQQQQQQPQPIIVGQSL